MPPHLVFYVGSGNLNSHRQGSQLTKPFLPDSVSCYFRKSFEFGCFFSPCIQYCLIQITYKGRLSETWGGHGCAMHALWLSQACVILWTLYKADSRQMTVEWIHTWNGASESLLWFPGSTPLPVWSLSVAMRAVVTCVCARLGCSAQTCSMVIEHLFSLAGLLPRSHSSGH